MDKGLVNEAVEKFRVWLLDKYQSYCTSIVDLIDSDDAKTQVWFKRYELTASLLPSVLQSPSARREDTH